MDLSDLPPLRISSLIFTFFLMIVLFSACGKKNNTSTVSSQESFVSYGHEFRSTEDDFLKLAKYADIPVPVGFTPVSFDTPEAATNSKKTELLSFGGDMSCEDVIHFYKKSFERDGWEIRDVSNEYEGLLWCTKLRKSCAVSIRPETTFKKMWSYKTYVYIFLQKSLLAHAQDVHVDINSKQILL